MAIVTLKDGDLASVTDLNNNFTALNNGLTQVGSSIVTMGSTISSLQSNLEAQISTLNSNLEAIYPVGSIYIGVMDTCPIASLFGTWEKVSSGRVLQGADDTYSAGSTIAAGLPNITGTFDAYELTADQRNYKATGAFYGTTSSWAGGSGADDKSVVLHFDASRSNSIYNNSTTVQPPAFVVNIWKRTA